MNEKQIKEVMRLGELWARRAWNGGKGDEDEIAKILPARAALEAYLRTIGEPAGYAFPPNSTGAKKFAQFGGGFTPVGLVFSRGESAMAITEHGRVYWDRDLVHPISGKPESVNAELLDALLNVARMAEALKQPCGTDPESRQAIRNGKYMIISYAARAAIARAESAMPFWPDNSSAISDPLFHQARGIMGTENFGQEEGLRLAILHVLNARAESSIEGSPKPVTFPAMKAAFRTTRVEAGEFIMAFKFRDIEDMDRADDEWRAAMAIETPAKVSPCAGHAVQQEADEAGGA